MLLITGVITYPTAAKTYIKSVENQLQEEFLGKVTIYNGTIKFDANLEDKVNEFLESTGCSLLILDRPLKETPTLTPPHNEFDARYSE